MKKTIFLVLLITLCCSKAYSQNGDGFNFGLRVGTNISDITGSTGESRIGLSTGAYLDYNMKRFGFELGLFYNELGSRDVIQQGAVGNKVDYNLDYLNAHLIAKYQLFNGFRVFAGPQTGYLVNSVMIENNIEHQLDDINKWDVGVVAGVGYSFRFGLDLSASYTRGLIDIYTDERTAYNTGFRVKVGWYF